jgi:N4-(beta-N-acetylglucosaminyl)-L-asparaginase
LLLQNNGCKAIFICFVTHAGGKPKYTPIYLYFRRVSTRKEFLKKATLLGAIAGIEGVSAVIPKGKSKKPIVVSTWNFGVQANEAAWEILKNGGYALDAVEAGVYIPEADPKITSVGYGGYPDRDGRLTLDACIMDENLNCGSVACIENIMHPSSVARMVMEKTPHVMLVGEGAKKFAIDQGFKEENLLTTEAEAEWKSWLKNSKYNPVPNWEKNHDTIGMLALDSQGRLCGLCTTSGQAWKMHGRVGDSPIIGAGLYVDGEVGAATCSGLGEEMIRIAAAHSIVEAMRAGASPQKACEIVMKRLYRKRGEKLKNTQVAFLAIDVQGRVGAYSLLKGFEYAIADLKQQKLAQAGFMND